VWTLSRVVAAVLRLCSCLADDAGMIDVTAESCQSVDVIFISDDVHQRSSQSSYNATQSAVSANVE